MGEKRREPQGGKKKDGGCREWYTTIDWEILICSGLCSMIWDEARIGTIWHINIAIIFVFSLSATTTHVNVRHQNLYDREMVQAFMYMTYHKCVWWWSYKNIIITPKIIHWNQCNILEFVRKCYTKSDLIWFEIISLALLGFH